MLLSNFLHKLSGRKSLFPHLSVVPTVSPGNDCVVFSTLFPRNHIITLISHPSPMHVFSPLLSCVFLIACVHALPQDVGSSSGDLAWNNNGGVSDDTDISSQLDSASDQANPTFDGKDPSVFNSDGANAIDVAYSDALAPEDSNLVAQDNSWLSAAAVLSKPPPYYCDNGRRPACCNNNNGGRFTLCVWWSEFQIFCTHSIRTWTCCLKIYHKSPHEGVDCSRGFAHFVEYAPAEKKDPEQSTEAPNEDTAPQDASNSKFIPFPTYQTPHPAPKSCPAPGSKEVC